ncbi:MAG: lasso peptide biosynthesis B2 protein [Actinomycetota bacterium]|nr:lasso peptide biosynthesis B2 protein [Actinomycetota bacterium]
MIKGRLRRGALRWFRLPLRDKLRILYIACVATAAEVAVRFVPLRKLTHVLGIRIDSGHDERPSEGSIDRALLERAAAVSMVYRVWPGDGSCLRRSVVLGFLVRRNHPVLRLGVGRNAGEIEGHAWIEVDGRVLGEGPGPYVPLRGAADGTS